MDASLRRAVFDASFGPVCDFLSFTNIIPDDSPPVMRQVPGESFSSSNSVSSATSAAALLALLSGEVIILHSFPWLLLVKWPRERAGSWKLIVGGKLVVGHGPVVSGLIDQAMLVQVLNHMEVRSHAVNCEVVVPDVLPDMLHSPVEIGRAIRFPISDELRAVTEPAHESCRKVVPEVLGMVVDPASLIITWEDSVTVPQLAELAP